MKKRIKQLLLLVMVMAVAICATPAIYSESTTELKDKIEEADKRIEDSKKKLQEAKAAKASAEEQKAIIDAQISDIVSNIVALNNEIDLANAQIAEKEIELANAQRMLDNNKEYFKRRVVSMYKSGGSTYIELIFGAEDMNDFFNRVDMLQYVLENDKKIIDEMTEARDTVIAAKEVIETKKAELEEAKVLAEEQKAMLDESLAQQQTILDQLSEEIEINEEEAAAAQKEKDEFNKQLEEELAKLNTPPSGNYSGGRMAWPIPQGGTITSPYGYRTYPSKGLHTGLDIAIRSGSTIAAAESGTVIKVVHGTTGYGKYLMVDHGGGYVTLYAHTSKIIVSKGQKVARGEKIAEVGSTGFSTGPHLHFEVRVNGTAVNPIGYIT